MLANPWIVDNDFHNTREIFNVFQGLVAPNLDKQEELTNGNHLHASKGADAMSLRN